MNEGQRKFLFKYSRKMIGIEYRLPCGHVQSLQSTVSRLWRADFYQQVLVEVKLGCYYIVVDSAQRNRSGAKFILW